MKKTISKVKLDSNFHCRIPKAIKHKLTSAARARLTHEGVIVREALLQYFSTATR